MDLVGRDAEVLGESRVRAVHPFARFARRRVAVVRLHLEPAVVFAEPVDHRPARVRAAGILEECLAAKRRFGERGELGTDEFAIYRDGHVLRRLWRGSSARQCV
jgi:hypothetical protein